jgi:TolB-like protein
MMSKVLRLGGLAAIALLTGCAYNDNVTRAPEPSYASVSKSEFIAANYRAADALMEQFKSQAYGGPLIVATVVNIDLLEQSSTLGRLISEQVSARFSQRGFSVVEMKFRSNVYMKKSAGELLLTREINEIARSHDAQAVIVGTYGTSGDAVFINMKIVQPGNNIIVAAYDYVLPYNNETRVMLGRAK